ncbi:two component transcriptional regulator, winged helix family [Bacillus mycoides]|uniref:Two component transcriptional regulator, winged helix family n=1 Tax=Bacillus mycoides TaxID=1405 RepID=A0A1D3MJ05_BACMY|nr:response regulator transcription factor [Bacillus mycoides]MBJ8073029.1 response regulator transcription factor [Bacillus cereus]MBJ8190556.1 response regulator transcription factor [Bacillus cereus]OFD48713.1 two component transcriptional regulator, winged helix family [Bacillus mycoides]OFD50760.1 two component transcriptional regulator, winged helix family [Bacillus mycoides]OFD67062.1 two component transcriptional regulator, winged helix family [Bacillus mycoides]
MTTILVLEDEITIRSFITLNMKRAGFNVLETDTGEKALELLENHNVDIVILDVMLRGIDGFRVCKRIRKNNEKIGIIILTARVQEKDQVHGLTIGADDYIKKPFSIIELVARVQSLLRRVKENKMDMKWIHSGPFQLNLLQGELYRDEIVIDLTPTEHIILRYLMENSIKSISRDELLNKIWGISCVGNTKVIDVNISRLRQKIEPSPSEPQFLLTVRGKGYKWKEGKR